MTRARALLLVAATLVVAATCTTPASAAEPKRPSAGLRAYGLDWIQYLRPQDLPPTRYAVCIVDTGVAITPDTPPDSPNGPIIKRLSIDGGSGEPQGTTPAHLHGTRMAATAIAPRNNWGMVGMFPQGRVISVRATVDGDPSFAVGGYVRGINLCLKLASSIPVAAISLSIGCDVCASDSAIADVAAVVERSRERGIPVIASAGNAAGATVYPAAVSGVIPVAAGGLRGSVCPNSAFDARVLAIAPACPVTSAEPLSGSLELQTNGGSSVAALELAVTLAALRTLKPEASSNDSLGWIAAGRREVNDRPTLDGRRAARSGGLASTLRVMRSVQRRLQ